MFYLLLLLVFPCFLRATPIDLGVDTFFKQKEFKHLEGKRVGLLTNQAGVNRELRSTIDLFILEPSLNLVALFAPEHGIYGDILAAENVPDKKGPKGLPIYSLYGKTRRPTEKMLEAVDVIICDLQDIGSRSYTFATTLFYVMEEAAKKGVSVIVLDRPNPINGLTVDGPMLDEKWRSIIGYLNVPYCHGMTLGELALFFNAEYQVGCSLKVIPMKGWKRSMTFRETGLTWIPTSPYVPEGDSPIHYACSGLIGELGIVSIGIGYTLPFKLIGAPWIKAADFAGQLNAQGLPGITFFPLHFRPMFGLFQGKDCQGVMLAVTNPHTYRPFMVEGMLMGILKNMYPKQMESALSNLSATKKDLFCKACGNSDMLSILKEEKYVAWKLILYQKEERELFMKTRLKYLLY